MVVTVVVAAASALALSSCKSTPENGYAVDVTVVVDQSVSDAVLGQVRTLDVSVSGAETFHTTYPIAGQLAKREAKFIYRPAAKAGTLVFAVDGIDGSGVVLARGQGTTALKNGATVTLDITLSTPVAMPDMSADMCPEICPTVGATRCMGTQVQSCVMMGACQQWTDAADCGSNMLCCADACVAADVSNCFACGTTCSGSTPACLPAPKKCGCSVAVCAATSMGCDTATGDCVACTAPATKVDLYVDATSFAGGTGTAACPFKTVTAALAFADATTKTLHVAPGTYDAALGETYPFTLRNGLSLIGAGAAATILKGSGSVNHAAAGGQFNTTYNVSILTGDVTGTTTIQGVTVIPTVTVPTAGYLGIFCDRGNAADTKNAAPPATLPTPTTVINGVVVGPNYDWGVIVTTTTAPAVLAGCNLKMVGSTIRGNNTGTWAVGAGDPFGGANPKVSVAAAIGDGTAAGSNTLANNITGLVAWDAVSPLFVDRNTFDAGTTALSVVNHAGPAGGDATLPQPNVYEVRDNTFKNQTSRGVVGALGTIFDQFTGNSFTHITSGPMGASSALAVQLGGNTQVGKARNNSFIGNDNALEIDGGAFAAPRTMMDWGSAAEAGNNVFACNSSEIVGAKGLDLYANFAATAATLSFRGNKWDHVPPTTVTTLAASANGQDFVNIPAATFDFTGGAAANVTCPAGHVAGP
jgi:hypothetical protein